MKRVSLSHWIALATAWIMAACVAPSEGAPTTGSEADVIVVMKDVYFEPAEIEVPAGAPIDVLLVNEGGIVHDLVFDGWESGDVRPGRSALVTLEPLTASVRAWCSIPGHRDAGMELDLIVVP